MILRIIVLAFLIPLVLLMMSHFGVLHPLGDSLAVFRGPLVAISVLSLVILARQRMWMSAIGAIVLVFWSAYTVLAPKFALSVAQDAPFALYQKNMRFLMPDTAPVAADILSLSPDFVTLQEVNQRNLALLQALRTQYPSQAHCPFSAVGGVAVVSRWPKVAGAEICEAGSGMVAMQVETPDGPVWLVSLHLHWAFPFGQAAQVEALIPALQALEGPVVLGGDFNMVPWSYTMRAITEATDTRRIGVPKYTLSLRGLYTLPIDHVLVSTNAHAAKTWIRPHLGSDHKGVLARFFIRWGGV